MKGKKAAPDLNNNKNYFPVLTGIRAIAAIMVFLYHYNLFFPLQGSSILQEFVNQFQTGVSVFFVLSGFLICCRYYDDLQWRQGNWFRKYIKNRIARIYPMYFLLTVCIFVFFTLTGIKTYNNPYVFLANIFFVRGFFNDIKFTGIAQGWTLTVEETFYFLAPVIFIMHKKYKRLFIQPILLLLSGFLIVKLCSTFWFYGFMGSYKFMLLYTFFGRSTEFFAGIALALFIKKKNVPIIPVKFTYLGSGLIVFILLVMALLIKQGHSYIYLVINNFILPFAIAIFFYGLITEQSFLKKMLSRPKFQLLGKSSYVFYLIHLWFIEQLYLHHIAGNPGIFFVLFIPLWLISIWLYKFLEEPINKAIRRSNFLGS